MEIEKIYKTYKGKKVLITGHTGFKGSWLTIWMLKMGADVIGFSLPGEDDNKNFRLCKLGKRIKDIRGDIRNRDSVLQVFKDESPDIVFNLAAQALVIDGYKDPVKTFETNIMGTVNVLEAIRLTDSIKAAVFVTTDKVYENREWVWPYREEEPLGGYDPYSSSKGASELVINAYRSSFFNGQKENLKRKEFTSISSARSGNVIGGGDWSKNRIVPDCIRSIEENEIIQIRNPMAIRPWQHVLDPLFGYMLLGYKMINEPDKYNEAWNFGPENGEYDVKTLVNQLINSYGAGSWADISDKEKVHEAKMLALDINKAKYKLKWAPVLDFKKAVDLTVDWYKKYRKNDVYELCSDQIDAFHYQLEEIYN